MTPNTPEPAAIDQRAFFKQEIERWFPDTDWLASEARHLPGHLDDTERMEAVGVASVISPRGETHGVVVITDHRVICQGFSTWARWECPISEVVAYEPSVDEVTFYRVHAGDAIIQVLRALGPQGEPDAPMGRRFRELAKQNRSSSASLAERDSEESFAREVLKRSMA